MKIKLLFVILSFLSSQSFAVDISKIEKDNVGGIAPIISGGITIPIPVVFRHNLPPFPQDNGSLGSTDSDDDGIRDDIEWYIAEQYPLERDKRGYLYHAAAYARKVITAPSSPAVGAIPAGRLTPHQVLFSYGEIGKATYCMDTEGRDHIRRVVAMNMDSKERFVSYVKNVAQFTKAFQAAPQIDECEVTNKEALRSDHSGFHSDGILDLHGYVTEGIGITAVNKTLSRGIGINAPKRFTIYNKSGSDGDLTIKVWESGTLIAERRVNKGQHSSFTFTHSMLNDGRVEYEVFKESGETVLFNIIIEPHI
ncbi:hypothetical protein [Pseudoalteromonas luteoviolacea]|uniref:Uncharacterized protein n=1 Tax=Pseudoalteromonas luteoviolacea S4054 TaxID=1129367 RepID=A0A0F6ACD2_9GAMM|nr:hypothetical protein [Pseudoalteromonas luteoviolacea]AOT08518.1 hypothetical protein S4054249_11960 [Pseudoalteromonas luteoviolacea]AOT13434.1 hypothetical protein S40542_11935 [Pseudoalteromonas luteoviolacea]AOT18347.1 hypothetical protein S4054_11935 [Pseudoalteromonas luteoviolacea]KKE83486.1 hypothetical protein N479_14030 [Pseudoalteromonas luteoviolacea S4054]KZN75923.1 hypothetical protein N481_06125 [Pseudoalteromonas luteoviolacea S4047-1]